MKDAAAKKDAAAFGALFYTEKADAEMLAMSQGMGAELIKGLGAAPGLASGPVRVIRELSDATRLNEGDVLEVIRMIGGG